MACNKKDTDDSSDTNEPTDFTLDNVTTVYDLVYGGLGNDDDELVSGMVMDNSGNVYFSMNVTTSDANRNIIYAKINVDGSLGWAKVFDKGEDKSPDSGENGETGGTAGSISIDANGYVYIVGYSETSAEGEGLLVLKVNPADGSLIWQKEWKPSWPTGGYPTASQDAGGYAIDAHGDYVYVTGDYGLNPAIVLALDKQTGDIYFQKSIGGFVSGNARGYAIYQSGTNLFVGGVDGSYAWFAKISNATSTTPTLEFVKNAGLPFDARINQILSDGNDIFFSCDIRGASTKFMVMKSDMDGGFVWAKSCVGSSDDRNNTHVIYLNGDNIYAGGRIGVAGLSLMGDALTLKMSKSDGVLNWAKIYYTGKDKEDAAEQRVKGIAVSGNNVVIVGQIYPSDGNIEHYYGNFVLPKDKVTLTDESVSFTAITTASFDDFTGEVRDAGGTIADYTVGKLVNSKDKDASNPPDCDAFIIKFQP